MENWFVRIGVIGVKMSNGKNKVANIESGMSLVLLLTLYLVVFFFGGGIVKAYCDSKVVLV